MTGSMTKDKKKQADRHKSRRKMVPVPEEIHERLKKAAQKGKRPLTWQVLVYLEKGLEADGC
jgi:hypothetical protein